MKRITLCLLVFFSPAAFGDYNVSQTYWCATCCDRTADWRRWRNDAFNKSFTDEISGELGQRIISVAINQVETRINFNLCSSLTNECIRMTANLEVDSFFSLNIPIPWIDVDVALVIWGRISGFRIRFTKANGDPVDEQWHINKPKLPIRPPLLPFEPGHCLAPPPPPPGTCSIVPPEETATTVVFLRDNDEASSVQAGGALSVSSDLSLLSSLTSELSAGPELTPHRPTSAEPRAYAVTGCEVPLSETVAGLSPQLLSIVPQHGRVKDGKFVQDGATSAFDATQLECLSEKLREQHGRSWNDGEWFVVNKPLHPENHRNPEGRMPELILSAGSTGVGLDLFRDRPVVGSVPMVIWGDEELNVLGPALVRPELINDPMVAHLQAELQNKLRITAPDEFAHPTMWIVDVKYDAAGQPVSLQRIEAATPQCCGPPCGAGTPIRCP